MAIGPWTRRGEVLNQRPAPGLAHRGGPTIQRSACPKGSGNERSGSPIELLELPIAVALLGGLGRGRAHGRRFHDRPVHHSPSGRSRLEAGTRHLADRAAASSKVATKWIELGQRGSMKIGALRSTVELRSLLSMPQLRANYLAIFALATAGPAAGTSHAMGRERDHQIGNTRRERILGPRRATCRCTSTGKSVGERRFS